MTRTRRDQTLANWLTLTGLLTLLAGACSTSQGAGGAGLSGPAQWRSAPGAGTTSNGGHGGGTATAVLPPAVAQYTTEAGRNGVGGGPEALRLGQSIAEVLKERGGRADADETLAAVARWHLDQAIAGRTFGPNDGEVVTERLGFAGSVLGIVVMQLQTASAENWREMVAMAPRNLSINRYGVWMDPGTGAAAVAFGAAEVTLAPFPRRLAVGQSLRLRGEVDKRFARAEVFLTAPDGTVAKTPFSGRAVDVALPLRRPGIYRVEVVGDGGAGPAVLTNVPLFVGVADPEGRGDSPDDESDGQGGRTSGGIEAGAQQMLLLLNRDRAAARLPPLAADAELAALALGHSRDMATNHFFGHISPTTGAVDDRAKRAGVAVAMLGENVAQGASAASAHAGLMNSPGHRANMLSPEFTHVGIGLAPTGVDPPLVATMVFARRLPALRLTAPEVLAAISEVRRSKGLTNLSPDTGLRAAAQAGMSAFTRGAASSPDQALAVTQEVFRRDVASGQVTGQGGCATWLEILERADLERYPLLLKRGLRRAGVAVALRSDQKPPPLAILILFEGSCE